MAISPDQRATLALLLERGQSYGDLASLLGVDEAEVRARARAALTELGGADPDRNVGLTDYLVGQADPIGRADVSRHLRADPADHALATTISERLRELFPQAELPRLPGEPRQGRFGRRSRADRPSEPNALARRAADLSTSQIRLLVGLGSGAILLIVIVLAITGAFSGGDDEGTTTSADATTTAQDDNIRQVDLTAPNGGDAVGQATFGLATGDQPFVDLSIQGLDPAPKGQTYAVWLLLAGSQGYPLSPIAVDQQGNFQNRFSIPSAVLPVVARARFVDISIAPIADVRKVVSDAIKNQKVVLDKPGRTVLQGTIASQGQGAGQGSSQGG